jgi:hypothetical protein
MKVNNCTNMNHRRANSPVRICPQCGEVVNQSVAEKKCSEESHAKMRKQRNIYCVDCGERLIGQ